MTTVETAYDDARRSYQVRIERDGRTEIYDWGLRRAEANRAARVLAKQMAASLRLSRRNEP